MPINISQTATWIILNTFTKNVWIKSIWAIFTIFINKLFIWQEFFIFLMFLMYLIDFLVWLALAFKLTRFNLSKFFFWSSKILIYWIYLVMWLAIWEILHLWNSFTMAIIWFTVIRDSISILEKLDTFWYDTPIFLKKHLISYKNKLENGK